MPPKVMVAGAVPVPPAPAWVEEMGQRAAFVCARVQSIRCVTVLDTLDLS